MTSTVKFLGVLVGGVLLGVGAFTWWSAADDDALLAAAPSSPTTAVGAPDTTGEAAETTTTASTTTTTTTVPTAGVGEPYGEGLVMFRGNPTRNFYGTGPISDSPSQLWRYPGSPMCSTSSNLGETKVWCGMGWTGQPAVHTRDDGVTELIFGAYDGAVHFVDAETGAALRPPFPTGDLIKGSVTIDPDGFPLLYFGSRDNKLRILALDRETPTEIWSLDAYAVDGIWNDDWDANPLIVDDVMYEGGENGWFFVYKLNRSIGGDGLVSVDPQLLFSMRGYDEELISKSGNNVSIESSTVMSEGRVYFANSGGRVVGLDVSNIGAGEAPVVFDYYAGGDIDATIVADEEGFVYVAIENEPSQMGSVEAARNEEVGQLVKLDPFTEGDPRVWGLDLTAQGDSGLWATPALYGDMLYVNTHTGELIAVDKDSGEIVWRDQVGYHSWSSPAVVDGTLVVATCTGELRGYSLADPASPTRLWSIPLGEACLEATPAIWEGTIFLGSRDGYIRAFR
ncbi:MAG: PQQ-binding-like beta-propeller repeat protein [Actinobacteria bacterium]|nr:PQQ-binding-like beta-propeller repeat protein [Actinomycetota bacterium]